LNPGRLLDTRFHDPEHRAETSEPELFPIVTE
jgi:hypothetical protein